MTTLRQFLSLSLAMFLGLTSTNAYLPEQPQLPEQIEAAILLNEDGTPRCRVGQTPELEDLRECDESDELYTEEISLGMAAPSTFGTGVGIAIFATSIAFASACTATQFADLMDIHPSKTSILKFLGGLFPLTVIGIGAGVFVPIAITARIAGGVLALEGTGIFSTALGVGSGLFLCSYGETSDEE